MDTQCPGKSGVKDRLLEALFWFAGRKDWTKVTATELIEKSGVARASFYRNFKSVNDVIDYGIQAITLQYHQGQVSEDAYSREQMIYKFRFYRQYASLILALHQARAGATLLELITDCEIDSSGDMPNSSLSKYALYYYAGAFYNMVYCWLEGGAKESPEVMADEFLRLSGGFLFQHLRENWSVVTTAPH